MHAPTLYRAEGLSPLVAIADDGRLMATLGDVMLGWNIVPVRDAEQQTQAAIRIEHGAKGWTCSGETYDKPVTYRDPVATACSLIAALYKVHTLMDREGLLLHAAGVRIGGGLVLLSGDYRAGKSVVTTACAAVGLRVFSDDIIPLDPGGRIGQAPGLAIRLRLPLPEGLAPETRDFIDTHRIASNNRYAYIRPPPDRLARRGEAASVRAVVSLRRAGNVLARLSRLAPGDALSEIIRRNFARETPAGRILDAFDRLTGEVPCLRLSYDRAEDAVALLREAFEGALPKFDAETLAGTSSSTRRSRSAPLANDAMIHRDPAAEARERGGQVFLTNAEEAVIFHLNATGTALWRLLEQPAAFGELTAIFAAGFPDRDAETLASDLSRLIRDLVASGLVQIEAR